MRRVGLRVRVWVGLGVDVGLEGWGDGTQRQKCVTEAKMRVTERTQLSITTGKNIV